MPRALRGASWISVITELRRSLGSSSPEARPRNFSYVPTVPKLVPSNVGDCTEVMSIRVMRASAVVVAANSAIGTSNERAPRRLLRSLRWVDRAADEAAQAIATLRNVMGCLLLGMKHPQGCAARQKARRQRSKS